MRSGGSPAGSGRALRLDPFALPLRYAASDAAADGRMREVELHRARVVVRRTLSGMRMAINLPVSAFAGVALKLAAGEGGDEAQVAVMLAHKDPGLALPLYVSREADDAMAEWRVWGAVLGLPLLVAEGEGWRAPFAQIGALRLGTVRPRRRRRSVLRKRRPTILLRRRPGRVDAAMPVHRGEREIIARN
jgi:Family of unknown function (DUF6101)